MIARIIDASIANRFFIVLAAIAVTLAGFWAVRTTPVDALPDLSDVQVVVRSNYPGQAPRIIEDQVTYPLATTMLSVPGAKTVRGYSMFGDSYVYIIFEDGTDLYWARSRVLEYLNQVQNRLPEGVTSTLGPDATGVGWVYEYALVDRTGGHDLAGLRSLQDWFLRYELKTIPGIAEVASVGGMVKQYQIVLEPFRMASFGVTHAEIVSAIQSANQESGGSIVEMGEAEYMVRASGYLGSLDDFRAIPLRATAGGVPVTLGDVATIQIGPELRRGIAELNGEGEVAGGIIILRQGADARSAIRAVEQKLDELQASLPEGVEIVTTYDRSQLIDASVENLTYKLIEEFIVVALVCALFLWHARSALVVIITLPLGVLAAFIVMRFQGVNANIMSLGGIAIAIGAMVDAGALCGRLLGTHVLRRPEELPVLREQRLVRQLPVRRLRDPEVDDLRFLNPPVRQHDVVRGDVAMDHALLMGMLHRVARQFEDAQPVRDAETSMIAETGDALAVDPLHHEKGATPGCSSSVIHRSDARVRQPGQDLALSVEARQDFASVHAELDDLQGDSALKRLALFG